MTEEHKRAVEAETRRIENEANLAIIQRLVAACAELRVENATLRADAQRGTLPSAPGPGEGG